MLDGHILSSGTEHRRLAEHGSATPFGGQSPNSTATVLAPALPFHAMRVSRAGVAGVELKLITHPMVPHGSGRAERSAN